MKKCMMAMLITAILVIASVPFTTFAEEMPAEVLGGEDVFCAAVAEEQAAVLPAAEVPGEALEASSEVTEEVLAGAAYSWADLQKAIDLASSGDEIDLPTSVTASEMNTWIIIPAGKTIILDLNGYYLDRGLAEKEAKPDGTAIAINFGASLVSKGRVP